MTRPVPIPDNQITSRFALLFDGRRDAFGSGAGMWIKRHIELDDYANHLAGKGPGIGIAPLNPKGTVRFAAIDLDEPDFGFAREVAALLPGSKFIERSRSGNAHVWALFSGPVEGWVPRGLMLNALEALGRNDVEVFPKQDRLREGMLGNYINLPYHGSERPMVELCYGGFPERVEANLDDARGFPLRAFLKLAARHLNDPEDWRRRARALSLMAPEDRPQTAEFGTKAVPHPCGIYIWQNRKTNPVRVGHRAVVLFSIAKQFLNWSAIPNERALEMMLDVNHWSEQPVSEQEVRRIWTTALRGQYTSTGCDDPLMADYIAPDCKIGHP